MEQQCLKAIFFIKTLLFCANFLRKMTKIKISDQLYTLLFYVQHLFQSCVKHIARKQTFNNVNKCDNII
jgi:hypothetical protein